LSLFGRRQKLARSPCPLHLDHLVEEARLVGVAPRLGLDDATLTHDPRALLTQPAARGAEVASAPAQVRSKAQVGDSAFRAQRMRSAKRHTRVIAPTSSTRTTSTPRRIAAVTVAA